MPTHLVEILRELRKTGAAKPTKQFLAAVCIKTKPITTRSKGNAIGSNAL
jgi:hypothetical protein